MNGETKVWSTDEQRRELRHLAQVLTRFRDVYSEMPVQQMLLLIYVGTHGEVTQKDLATALDLTTSAVSRNIATLSTLANGIGKTGLGLITWVDHPTDRRAKLVVLTPKGRTLVASLV